MAAYLNIQQFIRSTISEQSFTEAFKARCNTLGLYQMEQLLNLGSEKAVTAKYLGTEHFQELVDYLYSRHLLFLLK